MRLLTMTSSVKNPRPGAGGRGVRGFTIIELMVTMVVLAVILSLAAPSFSEIVRDQRVKTATFDVYASLVFARSEAIKRNTNVNVCIASGTDWASGWTVKLGAADCSGTALKTQDTLNGINVTGPASPVTYQGDGRLSTAAPIFALKAADSTTVTARCVRLDLSGRPNVKVDTDKDAANGCQ